MVSSGIPLHYALVNLAEQFEQQRFREAIQSLAQSVRQGKRFSQSLAQHRWLFGPLHRFLITIGEETGGLDLILQRLANYEERSSALRQALVSRLAYPAVLMVIATLTLLFLPAFALEGIFKVIESTGGQLPTLTVVFIKFSRLLRNPLVLGVLTILGAAGLYGLKEAWLNSETRKHIVNLGMAVPVMGRVLRNTAMAGFASALAIQFEVGVSPLKGLPAAAMTTGNPQLIEEVEAAVEDLKSGVPLSECLQQVTVLSPTFLSVVTTGEESGKMPEQLGRLAVFYEQQVDHSMDTLTSLLEPVILCVMGAIFAVMLVATMLPLVNLVKGL